MKELKKTYLQDFRDSWTLCAHCGTCNARGPVIPHNWKELPPPEWTSPYHRCPSFEYFNFRTGTTATSIRRTTCSARQSR